MPWTRITDMHSGGRQKLHFGTCVIEAGEKAAVSAFREKYHRDPEHISCECCGEDYSVWEMSNEERVNFDMKAINLEIIERDEVLELLGL